MANYLFKTLQGKEKAKSQKKTTESAQSEIEREAEKRLQDFLSMNNLSAASAPPQSTSSMPSRDGRDGRQSEDGWAWTNDSTSIRNANALRETTKAIFIKRLELTINGTPIDQV